VAAASFEDQPIFYFDLGDPACYLVAERVMSELPIVPEWEPVLAATLGLPPSSLDRETVERHAVEQGLQALRWPATWPGDGHLAGLVATYAKHIGRAVAFSLACFRQTFAAGRDPADEDTVLIAAAACEIHPSAVLKGIGLRSVASGLETACARATTAGVRELPAIQVGEEAFAGADCIEQAAAALEAMR
jgi:2-hydroxychromene-2-carboxylate isomerase